MKKLILCFILNMAISLNAFADGEKEAMKVINFVTNHNASKVSDSSIKKFLNKENILYSYDGDIAYELVLDNFDSPQIIFQSGTDNFQGIIDAKDNNQYSQRLSKIFNIFKKELLNNGYKFIKNASVKAWSFDDSNDYTRCFGKHNSTKEYIFKKNKTKVSLRLVNGSVRTCINKSNGSIDEKNSSGSSLSLRATQSY